jgi:GNAT superfamily N-acetyltransferase
MVLSVRRLRDDEARTYLEIVNSAIRGLTADHYSAEHIAGWVVPLDDHTLAEFRRNQDGEIRFLAELDGTPAGIGALVVPARELRACYVMPGATRRGCGAAIVREIERVAAAHGVSRLWLAASLNAEAFYKALGYNLDSRTRVRLRNGHELPALIMAKQL